MREVDMDTVLLAVPGTLCSPAIFDRLGVALGTAARLETLDWMTGPAPWDLSTVAGRLTDRVHALRGRIVLFGHSTGGAIVLRALADDPGLAAGLVLADTGAHM